MINSKETKRVSFTDTLFFSLRAWQGTALYVEKTMKTWDTE